MFLSRKRRGASFLIMVVIMALVMSMFAVSVSQLTRTRSATLISDATEKQLLYLAEDAVNQKILELNETPPNKGQILPTSAPELGSNFKYAASYFEDTKPFNQGSGTVMGKGSLVDGAGNDIYSKTVYVEVLEGSNAKPLMVYVKSSGSRSRPYYRVWQGTYWGGETAVQGATYIGLNPPDIRFIALSFDPGSDHAMLGMQDSQGRVWAQEWDGTAFASSGPTLVSSGGPDATRAFDIAYENAPTGGVNRVILVFCGYETSGQHPTWPPYYRVWNGALWEPQDHVADVPTTERPAFIELAMNPITGSKEIGMIYQDSDRRVFGEVWDGTKTPSQRWNAMGQSSSWGRANSQERRAVGVAYQNDGTLVFGYGEGDVGNSDVGNSRVWNGTPWPDPPTEYQFTADPRTIQWLTMNAVPTTNDVVAVYTDDHGRLYSSTLNDSRRSIPEWNTSANYHVGDLVTHGGAVYESTHDPNHDRHPPSEAHYWRVWSGGGEVELGTVYSASSPYFAFASGGADKWTVVFSSHDSALLYRTWTGGPNWDAVQHLVGNNWTPSYVAVVAPDSQTILSAYYPDEGQGGGGNGDDEDEVQSIVGWHTTNSAGTWVESSFDGDPASHAYERIAIAIPAASGSGFTVVAGTWRESY